MYIYLIKNKINDKRYVGQTIRKINESKDYFGSGKLIKRSIKKHGIDAFEKIILEECNNIDILNEREMFWIKELNTKIPNGYNLTEGGDGSVGLKHLRSTKKKMSKSHIKFWKENEWLREEYSEKFSGDKNPFYGKHHTEESIEKIKQSDKSYTKTEEFRLKMSKITTGRVPSKETRKKISDSNIGKPKSDETKESIVMGLIKYFETHDAWNKGLKNTFKHTDEAKKKMSKPGELNPFYDKHHT